MLFLCNIETIVFKKTLLLLYYQKILIQRAEFE